jgi:hypothetical protein
MSILEKKCFKNKICQECIAKNIQKYGKFDIQCNGITVEDDVAFAIKNGISEEDARWLYDTRYFFNKVYGSPARKYQEPILLCTSRNLVSRQCRQTGKTLSIVFKIMHYLSTNDNKTVLIVTPNEAQIKKIYEEYILRDCIYKNDELKDSIVSKSQKPYYKVELCNGSKVVLMVASETVRGQSSDWIYIDEAAIIGSDLINSILMTIASRGDNATIIQSSTPKGRGNQFYKACKEYSEYNEYHVSIYDVDELKTKITSFKKQLGEFGFAQEAEAEFPDISGGPFNYAGIDKAKTDYQYEDCIREDGIIYIGGVDWNGPAIGTYLTVIGFDPNKYTVKIVERKIVSSNNWNSLAAKQALIDLNRKWICKHWMVDYGFSNSIVEELRAYSMKIASQLGNLHPDSQLKYIIDPIEFGSLISIVDPFTKEEVKKTTRSFIVQQLARLFEVTNGSDVPIKFPKDDKDLIESLENYKLLNVSTRGYEQYGFDKSDGIEDHLIDTLLLATFGIIKYYNELFKRIIYQSSVANTNAAILGNATKQPTLDIRGKNVTLISDNDNTPIELDEKYLTRDKSKTNERNLYSSSTFSRSGIVRRSDGYGFKRKSEIIRRTGM